MELIEKLRQDLKSAMQASDQKRTSVLRMLFSAIKNKEIEERKKDVGLGGEDIIAVVQREAKKRKDAITEYEKAGRPELAQSEKEELAMLAVYLPEELPDQEIIRVIQDGIRQLGSPTEKDTGALMKIIMPSLKGRASGDRITKLAKDALGAQ
ncbi:MAG: GatB/YqeY domain-containing protein [Candidatus Ryanbacteria bacterium]|nr:GatB/YqeY domain-containing protein [Candidatus Ryanbacteria bacterium]